MKDFHQKNREMISIAIGVATLIGGGMGIYTLSALFPVPGVKFMLMAPYLSIVLYVIQFKAGSKFTLLKFATVFAGIMSFMNIFMGLAILLTGILTQLSVLMIKNPESRIFWGSVLFSGYTGVCALGVTKYFIGGVVASIPFSWLLCIGFLCGCFGVFGTKVAKRILKYMGVKALANTKF